MIGLFLLFLFAFALIAAPIGLNIMGVEVGVISSGIMTGAGIFLMLGLGIITIITKLYQRARANEAFVRTGMGGVKVIQDGGALVIPVIHEFIKISLETLKLEVLREHSEALITKDNLRADIGAEFFVKVMPDEKSILQAARSLGDKMTDVNLVKSAVEDKLISALRSVAATKTLSELHSNREAFVEEVTKSVNTDLEENGLNLESVTISKLDQTSVSSLKDDNIFDAQGKRTIAEITEKNRTERNQLERAGEQARKQQDVETRTKVLALEQEQQNAEARQRAEIAQVQVEQDRLAKEKSIEAQKSVDLAEIQKQQLTEIAAVEKAKAKDIALEGKEAAKAQAASKRAAEEASFFKAQAIREKEQQEVKTVELVAEAEREKRKYIIEAEAKAEQLYVTEAKNADAKAYQVKMDAEARKAAADADAEAVTKRADADASAFRAKASAESDALKAKAEGDRAIALVPVEIDRQRVKIEQDRIENVVKPELEAREKSGKVAQDFEIAKLKVEAEMRVRIESAKAQAEIGSKITMQLYGTPENATQMLSGITNGQKWAETINSFTETIDSEVGEIAKDVLSGAASAVSGAAKALNKGNGQPSKN